HIFTLHGVLMALANLNGILHLQLYNIFQRYKEVLRRNR
ncbi:MAG: hypothetical protein QG626_433, partial [Patescibacteria group bacterium]|nr:hypothetical protein [Patescibacteria group bacterium]